MGYEVHITRKENWFDEGPDISLDEWLDVVRADSEMRLDGQAEATVGEGAVLTMEDPSMSVWVAYSKHGKNGNMAWLWHSRGNVMAKNPDEEILRKMSLIAKQLSAKVRGDESEVYGDDGQPVDEAAPNSPLTDQKPWWQFW
jgi:hypothetical protein